MHDFMRVLGLAKRHSVWILLAVISMVAVAGTTVFAFNLLRPIYDELLRPADQTTAVVEASTGLVAVLDRTADHAEVILHRWVGEAPFIILMLALLPFLFFWRHGGRFVYAGPA